MVMELSRRQRKGIGYMIEGIIASVTIFVFAVGQTPADNAQDWSNFQKDITANDLSYTLKQTGDMNAVLEKYHTGSLETAVSTMTEGQLEVSGTVENLPLNDPSIGFTSTNYGGLKEIHTDPVRDVVNGDRCYGDLEEIEEQSGTSIKRTEDPGNHDGVVLYFADTDPQISGGFTDEVDYDTLYVDNGTTCQFSASEGPFYIDDFYRWNTSTSGEYEYYDFKNIDGNNNQFTYHNATLPFQFKRSMKKPINGIQTGQEIDTFDLSTTEIDVYDLIVLRREEAIEYLNANTDEEQKIKNYMRDNPVLVISNLSQSNVENGFIKDAGLEWIDLDYSSKPNKYKFSDTSNSRKLETYFQGLDGDKTQINLSTGGKISSSNSNSLTQENVLLSARDSEYDINPWNSTNYNMQQVDPDTINGKPESACYSSGPSSALTEGTFSFPEENSNNDVEYDVISAQMGATSSDCGIIRSISVDLDDDGIYTEENEGPFFSGETFVLENKKYRIEAKSSDTTKFIFSGNKNPEIVNYRESFNFQGDRLARTAYHYNYSEDSMKVISSTAYWLLGDVTEFGSDEPSSSSTTVLGSINENVYMPYKVSLRWR